MAEEVSIPSSVVSALRCVEYKFTQPMGVAPEKKYLMYRLKNTTDNTYLTKWKFYEPAEVGQVIVIDFVKDLQGILSTPPPPIAVGGVVVNNTIIKTIEVEYGTRTVNTEDCVNNPVDVTDGTTTKVDVLNGISRPTFHGISATGTVLHQRAERYSVAKNSYDWLYVIGNMNVLISFYTEANVLISSNTHAISAAHPESTCSIIPCGFQVAPANTHKILVMANANAPADINDLLFTVDGNFHVDDNMHEIVNVYFQNNYGGLDMLSFQSVDSMAMNVAKQEIINKYECGSLTALGKGQRQSINNNSFPSITLKRTFNNPINFQDAKWLNELAASGNVWVIEKLSSGVNILLKFQLSNNSTETYKGSNEFVINGYYSEVYLFPY